MSVSDKSAYWQAKTLASCRLKKRKQQNKNVLAVNVKYLAIDIYEI